MYIVELTYLKPIEAIEQQLAAHRAYLDVHYASGIFLASGPKDPRNGGVILASGKVSRTELEAVLQQDPFAVHGLASYGVIAFTPVKHHPALAALLSDEHSERK